MASRPYSGRMHCLLFFCVLFNLSVLVLSENVPVYIMGLKRSSSYPSVSAFESLSHKQFRDKYLDQLAKDHKSIVAFVQDKLSPEDLSKHRSLAANEKVFPHLENNLKKSPSLILPSVSNPIESLRSLKSHMNVREIRSEEKFEANSLKPEVLIYHLPSTLNSNDKKTALRKNDEIIHNLIKDLKSNKKDFVSIYTGLNPSIDSKAEMELHYRIARQLQEVEEISLTGGDFVPNGNFLNSSNLIVYGTGVLIKLKSTHFNITHMANFTWPPEKYSLTGETNKSQLVTFSYTIGDAVVNNVEIKLNFSNDSPSYFWGAKDIVFLANFPNAAKWNQFPLPLRASYVFGASRGFSFSCNVAELKGSYGNSSEKEDLSVNLIFQRFQAELFPKSTTKFSESFDCFTFFTIPIWMGTLTVILFTIILSIGIFMLFEVKTMDRFDDPKGKSISVPLVD